MMEISHTAISINVVGSKIKTYRQDRKVAWVVLFGGATSSMKENTVNVCLRVLKVKNKNRSMHIVGNF